MYVGVSDWRLGLLNALKLVLLIACLETYENDDRTFHVFVVTIAVVVDGHDETANVINANAKLLSEKTPPRQPRRDKSMDISIAQNLLEYAIVQTHTSEGGQIKEASWKCGTKMFLIRNLRNSKPPGRTC